MGRSFSDAPYPQLRVQDFGPGKQCRVEVHNGGRTVVIGDHGDPGLQKTHRLVQPGPDAVDVVIHGLPGRLIDKLGGTQEIPAPVVAQLLDAAGIPRGTPLRLLTCHAAEAPRNGPAAAGLLAGEWGGSVLAANGLLRIQKSVIGIDLVEWEPDPVGGMTPTVTGAGEGSWVLHSP
jgi:hypothetical protein